MLSIADAAMRRLYLGGSDVAPLMTGDPDRLMRLWKIKTGEMAHEDLDHIWPIALGQWTEQLQRNWFTRRTGLPIINADKLIMHPTIKFAGATLDGWVEDHAQNRYYPIEIKHCGGREPLETIIARYQPQCQWQMFVTDARICALSVILGADEPRVTYIPREDDYLKTLLERAHQFWQCVQARTPPVQLDTIDPPSWDGMYTVQMETDEWKRAADAWLQTHGAAESAEKQSKVLKSLVPKDARTAYGHGVRITRSRDNKLYLREEKKDGV